MSIVSVINRGMVTLLASTFLSTVHGIEWDGTFFMYFAFVTATVIFIFIFLPETRGVKLEDMSTLFGNTEEHRRLVHDRASNVSEKGEEDEETTSRLHV